MTEYERRTFEKTVLIKMSWGERRLFKMTLHFYRYPGEPWQFEHAGNFDGLGWVCETLPESQEDWMRFLTSLTRRCIDDAEVLKFVDGHVDFPGEYDSVEVETFGMRPILKPSQEEQFWKDMAKAGGITILASGGVSAARANPSIRDGL